MLISKFNLYNPEWLELVFDNRNKEYGAYNLRQHYARNMVMAMGIAFFSIAVLFGAGILLKSNPVIQHPHDHVVVVTLSPPTVIKPPLAPPKKPDVAPAKPATPVKTTAFVPYVVKPDPEAKAPVENTKLTNTAIGPVTKDGPDAGANVVIDDAPSNGTGGPPVEDVSVHTTLGLDVMPAPIGGESAWTKFLTKNLRFPEQAQEDRVSGRVFVSFIIEKDGHLSNIIVERGAGHGFDEEALRVLRLAKAWSPGKQNGQPVRVKYTIPINFQVAE